MEEMILHIFAYIKTKVKNPRMPEIGCVLDKIMHLYINSHRLVLTQGNSYIKLLEKIAKKAVINLKK